MVKSGFCISELLSLFYIIPTQTARWKQATAAVPGIKHCDERWQHAPHIE